MIIGLDLFSGIGGISLALKDWVKPIAYVEIDAYCQGVLRARMSEGKLFEGEIFGDIREYKTKEEIDIIYGGFPCQDISVAGNGIGLEGKRSGLFYEIIRLTKEIRPRFVFLENVPAIRTRGLHTVISEFTNLGYDCRWTVVSAKEVGAPHLRKRWFMLAHSNRELKRTKQISEQGGQDSTEPRNNGEKQPVADTHGIGLQCGLGPWRQKQIKSTITYSDRWKTEARICGDTDGIPLRVDRTKSLGNSVVPQQTQKAFLKLLGVAQWNKYRGSCE